jgi:hypothetical protein
MNSDVLESELRDVFGHLRARREWIGLTEEEVDQCYADTADEFQFYQAIEAKLKEKNT